MRKAMKAKRFQDVRIELPYKFYIISILQRKSESESIEGFENSTTYERRVDNNSEPGNEDVVIRQPELGPQDIEMTEGDLGLGDRPFNPRS